MNFTSCELSRNDKTLHKIAHMIEKIIKNVALRRSIFDFLFKTILQE